MRAFILLLTTGGDKSTGQRRGAAGQKCYLVAYLAKARNVGIFYRTLVVDREL